MNVFEIQQFVFVIRPDGIILHINMFCAFVVLRIFYQSNSRLIVAIDRKGKFLGAINCS